MNSLAATLPYGDFDTSLGSNLIPQPKMKFNPTKKTLNNRISELKLRKGAGDSSPPKTALRAGTDIAIPAKPLTVINEATAMNRELNLPTIADYENIEELNDFENIEAAFYEASKKFCW